jgi:hypothetical protein
MFFVFLQGLSIGTVDKIYLKFPYKWWPDGFNVFGVLKTNETVPCTDEVRNKIFTQQVHQISVNWEFFALTP